MVELGDGGTQSVRRKGHYGHFLKKLTSFMPLTARSLMMTHDSGVEGCKILKQWHGREMNFSRGKSRIFITFRGTQEILSLFYGPAGRIKPVSSRFFIQFLEFLFQ
jgi:hypothetical protein